MMYENPLEKDPELQKLVARAEIEGRRKTAMLIIEGRFPALTELAQQVLLKQNDPDEVRRIGRAIATAPQEDTLRWFLGTYLLVILLDYAACFTSCASTATLPSLTISRATSPGLISPVSSASASVSSTYVWL